MIGKAKEIADLEMDKRGKERQLKNVSTAKNEVDIEKLEKALQSDLREKEEEISRLKSMIRDKKLEHEQREHFPHENHGGDDHYQKITQDIDSVKLMILDLRANQAGVSLNQEGGALYHRRPHKGVHVIP